MTDRKNPDGLLNFIHNKINNAMQIERKLKFGFIMALGVMALTATVPFLASSWTRAQQEATSYSQHRIDQFSLILTLILDVETGQRGFVITGREEFLEPYHSAIAQLGNARSELRQIMKSSAESQLTLNELDQLLDQKIAIAGEAVKKRREQGFQADQYAVTAAQGKQYMDQIRAIVYELIIRERNRRIAAQAELNQRVTIATLANFLTTLFNISLLAVALRIVFRLLREREQASEGLRQSSEKLSAGLQELERRNTEISLVGQMARALESPVSVKETFEIISFYCNKLLPHTSGELFLFRNSRDMLEKLMEWNNPLHPSPTMGPQDCWALRRGQPHKVDGTDGLACPHHQDGEPRRGGSFCIPLTAQGDVLGLICIEPQPETDEQRQTLELKEEALAIAVSEQLALTLSNLKLRETLKQQSIIDPLTSLFNRRYMDETLNRELARASRKSLPLSVIVLDIDHFKNVNDKFGHDAGDTVLRSFAHCVKRSVRDSDMVCRLGGEELVLILTECDKQAALARAEKISADIRLLDIKHGLHYIGRLTASIGVATFPDDGDHADDLIKAADQAMYRAKNAGRDRIMAANAI